MPSSHLQNSQETPKNPQFPNAEWIPLSVNPGQQRAHAFTPTAKSLFGFPHLPLLRFQLRDGNVGMMPTSTSDGGFDQGVQLLITADRQLQMPGRDPLHFEILGSVPGQLQHLQDTREW